jgi:hypothetical protein
MVPMRVIGELTHGSKESQVTALGHSVVYAVDSFLLTLKYVATPSLPAASDYDPRAQTFLS